MDKNFDGFNQITQLFQMQKIAFFVFGIILLIIIARMLTGLANRAINNIPSRRLLILQIVTIIIFLIYIVGGITIFYGAMRPSRELLLAIGGSVAVAMGLALKDLVSSLVAGLVLLFDQPFQVGDRVTFDSQYGEIKSIGLRTVRLITLDDNLVTIPNARFLTDVVASANDGNMDMMMVFDFHLALDADLPLARKIINEVLITSKYIFLKKPYSIVVSEIIIGNMIVLQLKAKAYVLDVKYEKLFQTDVVSRVNDYFQENAIKRPLLKLMA
jgi:small-conductance mechanosensitive channel